MTSTATNEQKNTGQFPKELTAAAFLMIIFGLAEVVTSFTRKFFGLTTAQLTISTVVGGTIGSFYFISGILVLTKKKIAATFAIVLLIADTVGRIVMVISGLYQINSGSQTFAIIAGTSIVIFF